MSDTVEDSVNVSASLPLPLENVMLDEFEMDLVSSRVNVGKELVSDALLVIDMVKLMVPVRSLV